MPSLNFPLAVLCLVSSATLAAGQSARSWEQASPRPNEKRAPAANGQSGELFRPAAYQTTPSERGDGDHREIGASSRKNAARSSAEAGSDRPRSSGPLITTLASLAVVVGLFLLVMWLVRRHLPRGMGPLPADVFEVLGRAAVGQKQSVTLLRLGDRLLLVAISAAGIETLSEITDPDEVTRLLGICRQAQPTSATVAFRHVLQQMSVPPRATRAEDRHA